MKKSKSIPFFIWLFSVFILTGVFIFQVTKGVSIETNILNLLPEPEQDTIIQNTARKFSESLTKKILFLIGHPNPDTTVSEAQKFIQEMNKSQLFSAIDAKTDLQKQKEWFDFYFPYRYQFLSGEIKSFLKSENPAKNILRYVTNILYSPAPDFYGNVLSDDPLLLFPSFITSRFSNTDNIETRDGLVLVRDSALTYALIPATLSKDPFNADFQKRVIRFIDNRKTDIQKTSHTKLLNTGVIQYAEAAFSRAQKETSIIGIVSIVGIILLIFYVFGSMRCILFGSLPVLTGLLSAITVCVTFYDKIHIISLTMGACLTGVCIDYSLHFLSEYYTHTTKWDSYKGLKHILPGISLGALTSIMGYAAFFFTPFPGLRQIALFTCAGLIGAYLTVVLCFPFIFKKESSKSNIPLKYLIHKYISIWNKITDNRRTCFFIILFLAVLIFSGIYKSNFNDDIYLLKTSTPKLDNEESKIRSITNTDNIDISRFIIVNGKTEEALLQRLNSVTKHLLKLRGNGSIENFQSLSTFLPSIKQQKENSGLLQKLFLSDSLKLMAGLADIGYTKKIIKKLKSDITSQPSDFITPEKWIKSSVSNQFRHLWFGNNKEGFRSLIILNGIKNETPLNNLSTPEVKYINKVKEMSQLLKRYRIHATMLLSIAYIAIFFLLFLRYGLRKSLKIIFPPFTAAALTMALLSFLGIEFNLMHILSFLLVLAIGIDYTIFLAETKKSYDVTMLAVTLSAFTTILSFGLLLFSRTPALNAIGSTILSGILFALLLSPAAMDRKNK